jgi:hypothetical protein
MSILRRWALVAMVGMVVTFPACFIEHEGHHRDGERREEGIERRENGERHEGMERHEMDGHEGDRHEEQGNQ